jgi:hypothetical protein
MSERFSSPEFESNAPSLDKAAVLDTLFEKAEELGVDIAEEDLEGLLGEDDNDFLGNIATLALMNGLDIEAFFEQLGIPADFGAPVEFNSETE